MSKFIKRSVAGFSLASVTGAACAALPAGVQTAIEAAGADASEAGGYILIVMVTIAAFLWIRKVLH